MNRRTWLATAGVSALGLPVRAWADGELPELIQRSKPSLVLVGTYAETDSPRFSFRGTGFVVADGTYVVTCAHVLPDPAAPESARKLMVHTYAGDREWKARETELIAVDRLHDLALLRFRGAAVPAVKLAEPNQVREGAEIALMGFPIGGLLGFSQVTHRGIVSAITAIALPAPSARGLNELAVRQLREGAFSILQLDAVAYPGNSGGPVFDVRTGQVVGIVSMVITKGSRESALSQPSGISYAIPVDFVHRLLSPLDIAR